MVLESKNYWNETNEKKLEDGKKLDTAQVLEETKEWLGEMINKINFSVNKEAFENSPEAQKQMRVLVTIVYFMKKAVEVWNLEQKQITYELAKLNSKIKQSLNLKENPIKIV